MIKNVKIRILAFFMALTLSFCVVSSEYQEVKALEWAGTVVAFDTAIKAILGLLGVGVAVGTASQIDWGQLKDDCVDYQIAQGNNSVAVGKWWADVIDGALDTGSECWTSFKEWANSITHSSSGGSGVVSYGSITDVVSSVVPNVSGLDNYNYNIGCGYYYVVSSVYYFTLFSTDFKVNSIFQSGTYLGITLSSTQSSNYTRIQINGNNGNVISQNNISGTSYSSSLTKNVNTFFLNSGYTEAELQNIYSYFHVWGMDIADDNILDSAFGNIGDIALSPDVATDLPYDGVISIPWENVGATDTAIDDAFDDALDKVNTGTWTLDQYWTWVQNITNVFAYDTTNNFLLPNDGDDEKADDKIQQNINRGAMVLYGLEKVFPFCIPWDIYAFVNLLVAEPVAPVIEYPIYNPISGEDEVITIDFSVWESTVVLFRYIQDFLLIIGLLLLSRSLIGAGGSD